MPITYTAAAVALYIIAGYRFTASRSWANPAVTIADPFPTPLLE